MVEQASVSEIAQALAAYVQKNPEAQDTLEGIAQWWLPELEDKPRAALIKEALNQLVAEGVITAHTAKDAQILYRARAAQPKETRHGENTNGNVR